jgi:N-dimethylarginine dimethylaminohydrolase
VTAEGTTAIPGYDPGKPVRTEIVHEVDFLEELEATWGARWGAQSKIGRMRRALLCRPTPNDCPPEAREDPVAYGFLDGVPELEDMIDEHDQLVAALESRDVQIDFMQVDDYQMGTYMRLRSLWATASAFVVNGGAIIPRYGRGPWRRGQERLLTRTLVDLGCPILYTVHGNGVAELGGNGMWLDPHHIIVGLGTSGNIEGLEQVRPLFEMAGAKEIHTAYFSGAVHLDMVLGIAGEWVAVIKRSNLDHETIRYLYRKGFDLIDAPDDEWRRGACNLLALDEKTVVMPQGCPEVSAQLRKRDIEVLELPFTAIGKAGGAPHCAVGVLIRDPGPLLP